MEKIHDIEFLSMEVIETNEWNPNFMEQKAFDRLLREIRTSGFVSAIQVVKLDNDRFRIIGGEHRYRAAKALGYEKVPCVVLSEAQFQDVDLQKFLTVRLNMLSGNLDPDKFRVLYEEMADKYGPDSLEDLFGFTDEDQWNAVTKAIRNELRDAGIPKDKIKKAMEALEDDHSIEGLSKILNDIFSKNSDTLKSNGFMVFDFNDSLMLFIDVSKVMFKFFDELQINTAPSELKDKFEEIFNKVNVE